MRFPGNESAGTNREPDPRCEVQEFAAIPRFGFRVRVFTSAVTSRTTTRVRRRTSERGVLGPGAEERAGPRAGRVSEGPRTCRTRSRQPDPTPGHGASPASAGDAARSDGEELQARPLHAGRWALRVLRGRDQHDLGPLRALRLRLRPGRP